MCDVLNDAKAAFEPSSDCSQCSRLLLEEAGERSESGSELLMSDKEDHDLSLLLSGRVVKSVPIKAVGAGAALPPPALDLDL